jgi:hypothetical protein
MDVQDIRYSHLAMEKALDLTAKNQESTNLMVYEYLNETKTKAFKLKLYFPFVMFL